MVADTGTLFGLLLNLGNSTRKRTIVAVTVKSVSYSQIEDIARRKEWHRVRVCSAA